MGATLMDGLDTLHIAGLTEEVAEAEAWLVSNFDVNNGRVGARTRAHSDKYQVLNRLELTKRAHFVMTACQANDPISPTAFHWRMESARRERPRVRIHSCYLFPSHILCCSRVK